jgi:hypothetical protein
MMKNAVFWDVTPYGTFILTRATRHNIPEDGRKEAVIM